MTQLRAEIETYQSYLTQIGKSTHTVKAYSHDVESFARWFEQTNGTTFKPQVVSSRDIQEYRSHLTRQGRSVATINRRLKALKHFFRWAKRERQITDNPFEILEKIMVKEQKDTAPRWLEHKEQLALMRVVREGGNQRDLAIIQTLLGTGLRISELAALTLSDVTLSDRKGTLRVRLGKGSKAREIPLDNATRQALLGYLEKRIAEVEADEDQLFLGQRGSLSEKGIDYLVGKYAYQAKLENCTAHKLRHTFAKNLVDAGTPLDQIATLLGHESLETTRVYTRPSQQDLERAVRRAAGEL